MSNASNLSTLANVLDDASAGEFLKSTGSGGVAFDTVAAGAVVYATADLLPLSGNSAGDMAYVTATNRFYINNGSGWYSVSLVNTNPNITSVADASSGTTPFTLATDQTATVITITAADPEEVPLTYGYSVTSGSLNGSTVAQGTGNNTNVFTVTPHASQDATFTLTFTASDGINQATSANAFSLSFVTVVTDSNHTTLLATATGTSDNSNITDSSSNSHSITVNGDAHAGTFSPYRSGGYSTYFDGTGYLTIPQTSNVGNFGTGAFTVEFWFKPINADDQMYFVDFRTATNGFQISRRGSNTVRVRNGSTTLITSTSQLSDLSTWYHVCVHRNSSNELKLFVNGTQEGGTVTGHTDNYVADTSGAWNIAQDYNSSNRVDGYITDLRVTHGEAITPSSGGPTERLEASSNTKFLYSGTGHIADTHSSTASNNHSITVNGDVSTEPFSPYDYNEYDAADHGGSIYFDGTGDYLSLPTAPTLGTSDFEISMWVYPEAISGDDVIIDFRPPNTNGTYVNFLLTNGVPKLHVNGDKITGSSALLVNAWSYLTLTRVSGSTKLYVNGTQTGSTYSDSNNYLTASSRPTIGQAGFNPSLNLGFNGHMSDLIVKLSGNSSPSVSTAPLSSSGAALHLKGTDASIIDKSQGDNLKLFGTTTGSTDQVRSGDWANTKTIKFDGNSDYIFIPDDEAYGFGTDDWTIETWLYCTKTGGFNAIFDTRVGTGTETGNFGIGMYNTGRVQLFSGGIFYYPTNTLSFNTWQHFAVVKNSGTTTMYFNGTAASTTYSDSRNYGSSQPVQIGKDDTTSNYFGGYMQDFRISKGKARYTGNFTPPSAPLEG